MGILASNVIEKYFKITERLKEAVDGELSVYTVVNISSKAYRSLYCFCLPQGIAFPSMKRGRTFIKYDLLSLLLRLMNACT